MRQTDRAANSTAPCHEWKDEILNDLVYIARG